MIMTTTTAAASRMAELLLLDVVELDVVVVEIDEEGETDELVEVGGGVDVVILEDDEVVLVTL